MSIEQGTKVKYKVGRGFGDGTANGKPVDGYVELTTEKGKVLRRRADQVTPR